MQGTLGSLRSYVQSSTCTTTMAGCDNIFHSAATANIRQTLVQCSNFKRAIGFLLPTGHTKNMSSIGMSPISCRVTRASNARSVMIKNLLFLPDASPRYVVLIV